MNEFRLRNTGQIVTEAEYRAMYPNTSFPRVLVPDDADVILAAPPPPCTEHQTVIRDGAVQDNLGNWVEAYAIVDWPAEQIAAYEAAKLPSQAEYSAAMDRHFDAVAQTKRYSNRMTCAIRAGYPGVYQAEGLAFGVWMDNCNQFAYALLAQVLGGQVAQPTVAQFIEALPEIVWPS